MTSSLASTRISRSVPHRPRRCWISCETHFEFAAALDEMSKKNSESSSACSMEGQSCGEADRFEVSRKMRSPVCGERIAEAPRGALPQNEGPQRDYKK